MTLQPGREGVRPTGSAGAPAVVMLACVLLGAALVTAWMAWAPGKGSERSPIAALVEATGGQRLVQARLCGGFAWAPVSPVVGGSASSGVRGVGTLQQARQWEIARIASRIRQTGEVGEEVAHALGVAHLLLGDVDEAISRLELLSEDEPHSPMVLSDLAAALIERGTAGGGAKDLVRALDLSERARALAPAQPEPIFNSALARDGMQLRQAALRAWEDYLLLDAASPWSKEATARITQLRDARRPRGWAEDSVAFGAACAAEDRQAAASLARLHPQEATETVLSDLLPRWAALEERGDPAASAALAALDCAADTVSELVGDAMLADAVAQIRAHAARSAEARALARACGDLARGRQALDAMQPTDAREFLARAEQALERSQCALRDLAALYRLTGEYYDGAEIEPAAQALQERVDRANHRIVGARIRWLRGLSDRVRGRLSPALALLREAADRLDGMGFTGDAIFVRAMEAGTWRALGQDAEAWTRDVAVFARLDDIPDPRRTQALLAESARVTEIEGLRLAALVLQQVSLHYARQHDSAYDGCEGQVWLARMAARAGRQALAKEALAEAERLRSRVTDPLSQDWITTELALIRGGLALPEDPGTAAREASRALDGFRERGDVRSTEAFLLRARAAEAGGDLVAAEHDYLAAVESLEAQRAAIQDPGLRLTFFETAFDVARELVRFAWSQGRRDEALLLANRVRARTLREVRKESTGFSDLEDLRRRLHPSQAVLFYTSLRDKVVVWVLRKDAVSSAEIACSEVALRRKIQQWRRTTLEGDLSRSTAAARDLFDVLVTPVRTDLTSTSSVVVVPDGVLHQLAWASLRDPATGQPWIDRTAIVVTPSLSVAPGGGGRESALRVAVIVGDPRFDRALFPNLHDLPGALEESRTVAGFYPRATLLVGEVATAEAVVTAAEHADVLHVAAHGLADPFDAERSTLVLAPGGSVASDGALRARDIRDRDLTNLRLVVLAACRSGDGPLARAEGPLSLARPFLQAGAGAVLVSLFDLPDDHRTMSALHGHLQAGLGPVDAFRRAMTECWTSEAPDPRVCGGLQLIVNHVP